MAFGPLAGGWVFDAFGDYAWLFIGSAAVGLGAVLLALAFRRRRACSRSRRSGDVAAGETMPLQCTLNCTGTVRSTCAPGIAAGGGGNGCARRSRSSAS